MLQQIQTRLSFSPLTIKNNTCPIKLSIIMYITLILAMDLRWEVGMISIYMTIVTLTLPPTLPFPIPMVKIKAVIIPL